MAFDDIPLGQFMRIEDGECEVIAFVGEPEVFKNNFGTMAPHITVYHLCNGEWHCRVWGISRKTGNVLHAEYKKHGLKWPATAYEVSRTGASTDTAYTIRDSKVLAPTGLKPLTAVQMERGKWERDPIPAEGEGEGEGEASSSSAPAAPAATPAKVLRVKYRMALGRLDDEMRAVMVEGFGDADSCPDDMLEAAIEEAKIPF